MRNYRELRGHPEDFLVSYRLHEVDEGGDPDKVFQHIRCDFLYEGDDPETDGIYMIHPEFLDESGNPVVDKEKPVQREGFATMWILVPEMRSEVHSSRLSVGTNGYFVIGSRKIGTIKVEKIVGLYDNQDV